MIIQDVKVYHSKGTGSMRYSQRLGGRTECWRLHVPRPLREEGAECIEKWCLEG